MLLFICFAKERPLQDGYLMLLLPFVFFGMSEYIELDKQQIDFLKIIQRGERSGVCAP